MQVDHILVRFGELTTKGKNRKLFTKKLLDNVKLILKEYFSLTYDLQYDRLYINLNDENHEEINKKLENIFGIYNFSNCFKVERDIDKVKELVSSIINDSNKKSFKINTKRSDKNWPGTSLDINRDIASYVFKHGSEDLNVDVHNPEILVTVEIRSNAIYVMDNKIKGAGGYPVGIGGKALLMLSGGIDSPVAGYLTMKRGVDVECIHFAAPPYTNEQARQKVIDLADKIRKYGHNSIKIHVINFTKLQLAVYDNCDESYAMTVMRRMMYRVSEKLAAKHNCLAIVNGESIGQVASQTLNSMSVINEVISIPVIRPVVCLDKLEIIDIANKIDTYDISIRPFEDCCTIFTPKNPATKPKSYKAKGFEDNFDFDALVDECVDSEEVIIVNDSYNKNEELF